MLHEGEDGRVGQRSGDSDDERRRKKSNLLNERFPKLGAPLTVVLVCFAKGLVDIYREKNSPHPRQLVIWY